MDIIEARDKELAIWEKEIRKASDSIYGVLISHLYIDHLLERYIQTKFVKDAGLFGKNGLSFSKKLLLAQSFGELDNQLADSLARLNSIRNDCAHNFGFQISEKQVEDLGKTLGKDYKRIINEYPISNVGVIAPLVWNICGQLLYMVLSAEGYK